VAPPRTVHGEKPPGTSCYKPFAGTPPGPESSSFDGAPPLSSFRGRWLPVTTFREVRPTRLITSHFELDPKRRPNKYFSQRRLVGCGVSCSAAHLPSFLVSRRDLSRLPQLRSGPPPTFRLRIRASLSRSVSSSRRWACLLCPWLLSLSLRDDTPLEGAVPPPHALSVPSAVQDGVLFLPLFSPRRFPIPPFFFSLDSEGRRTSDRATFFSPLRLVGVLIRPPS